MMLPVVNILLHAFRSDSSHYTICRDWLDNTVNGDSRFAIAPQVLSGMVRVVTHPKVFANPSALTETLEFCDILISQRNGMIIQPGERHWKIFNRLCLEADARGNLVQDAWLAARAIESGCVWITLDWDFARFEGLQWRTP